MTTAHSQADTVIIQSNQLSHKQTVVASASKEVKVGDVVMINVSRFPVDRRPAKHDVGRDIETVIPPIEVIDGVEYLWITDREIKYKLPNG